MALLILLATPLVLSKMPTDIFPEINIPVVSIVWNYAGLSAQEVGQRITAVNDRSLSQTLFDAGKTRANVRIAGADHTAAAATYRQTLLSAMEEVENGVTGLTSLDRAATQADASVRSAPSISRATATRAGSTRTWM